MESAGPSGSEASSEAVMPAKATHQSRRLASRPSAAARGCARFSSGFKLLMRPFDLIEVEVVRHQSQHQKVGVPVLGPVAQARIHVARFVISQKPVDHVQGCSLNEIGRVGVLR